ncbi:MAG TPA: ribosomal protein L7/L12 [Gemmataceae bacterium]|jgi:uncharacterized protein (TIGR02996 family)|nr:ribosomal protein L7/L12 [Gemmataceae bacterium]
MSDEAALLAAIQAAPADDAPRLVYADWLDEHGRSDRADAIRAEHASRMARGRWESIRSRMDADWMARVFPANALVVRSYPPDRKIHVIKLIREISGCGLAEAKALSEALPACLRGEWPAQVIDRFLREFAEIGAKADWEYRLPADGHWYPSHG